MSHNTARRVLKPASGLALLAAILLAGTSPTWRDDLTLKESSPRGIPLHLLPDEKVVESYRSLGYVGSITSEQHLDDLFCSMLNQEMTPMLRYVADELERSMRLISEAFHTPPTSELYRTVLKSDESRRIYYRVTRREGECARISFGKKVLPPRFARLLEENISDLERLGLGEWAGYEYSVYAFYFFSINENEKAYECLRKSLACHVANGDMPLASQLAGDIGRYHLQRGNWGPAEESLLASLRYANEAGDKSFLSRALYSLARLRASQGYFAEAESLLVRSVDCGKAIADATTEITELIDLGELYINLGEYSRAGYLIERAILQAETNLADPAIAANGNLRYNLRQRLATAYSDEAMIQHGKGTDGAAIGTIRKALEYAEGTKDPSLTARLMRRLGDIDAAAGRPKEATRCYSDALAIAKRRHDRGAEAEYLNALGRLALESGQFEKAERYLAAALARNPRDGSWVREADIAHDIARARIALGDLPAARSICEGAIASLQAHLTERASGATRSASRERLDALFADLLALESDHFYDCDSLVFLAEKSRLLLSGFRGDPRASLDRSIRECMGDRGWIPENALVIQHLVTPERTIIIAMDRFGGTYRSIGVSREHLMSEVAAFIASCGARSAGGAPDQRDGAGGEADRATAEERARALYRLLIEPISPLVADKDVLCFVPDEVLRDLPFGALIFPGSPARFLVEEKSVLFSPNLLLLGSRRDAPGLAGRADGFRSRVLIGKPDISPLARRLYPALVNLPHAQEELVAIRRLFPGSTVLSGREATREAVAAAIRGADLIHVATHAIRYPVYGGEPALLLSSPAAGAEGEKIGASLLTQTEIADMKLPAAKLAFISSCESAIGREAQRTHEFGIGGAFLEAGVRTVVATVWPIEDAAAKEFATAFYKELLQDGGSPTEALRRAENKFIAEDRAAGNPLRRVSVWSPFIILGPFENRSRPWPGGISAR